MDLKLKLKVKASNIPGVQLTTGYKIVVRPRLYAPALKSATFQHSIGNYSATLPHVLHCYRNLSARSGNIREPIPKLSAFFRVAFGYFGKVSAFILQPFVCHSANTCRMEPDGKAPPIFIPKGSRKQQKLIGNPSAKHRDCSGRQVLLSL